MSKFLIAFVKLTAWPVQKICFRTKIYYEDRAVQGRRIKGPAILIANHTSTYDYAVLLFVFYSRILRYQMAEVLFRRKVLGWFLRGMGGVYVDREQKRFSFVEKSQELLCEGRVVGIFPEGRVPKKEEISPLPFVPSTAYIALKSGAPVIPVYTNGSYFNRKRARVMIGTPMYVSDYYDDSLTEKENLRKISGLMRDKILELKNELREKSGT